MGDRVGIVAVAQTRFEQKKGNQRFQEMAWEVVKQVRDQTGLGYEKGEIDNAVTCSDDVLDARTISDGPMGDLVGAHYGSEEKVDHDGLQALFYAAAVVLSGHSDITIVLVHGKESQPASRNMVTHAAFDPIFHQQVGLDYLSADALQARAYMEKYKVRPEQAAAAVVRDRKHAALNPRAQDQDQVTVEEVLKSPLVCDPLRRLDIYPKSDGAVAMIVANEKRAREITDRVVWIQGAGNCYDHFFLGDRDLWDSQSLRKAADRAYDMAGIMNPPEELDLVEVSAHTSYQELLWLECLEVCPQGKAGDIVAAQATELDAALPVNPSGGMLSGAPLNVSGMARAAECVLQLRGEAGQRQVQNARLALAHGTTGPAGQHHCVMIFSRD
jgi:acetyl-CoA C-acetyltransferase